MILNRARNQVVDQHGTPQIWRAHFWRYHVEQWKEFDTPEDAISFLRHGEDDGELSSRGVVWPDGTEREYDYVEDRYGAKILGQSDD